MLRFTAVAVLLILAACTDGPAAPPIVDPPIVVDPHPAPYIEAPAEVTAMDDGGWLYCPLRWTLERDSAVVWGKGTFVASRRGIRVDSLTVEPTLVVRGLMLVDAQRADQVRFSVQWTRGEYQGTALHVFRCSL